MDWRVAVGVGGRAVDWFKRFTTATMLAKNTSSLGMERAWVISGECLFSLVIRSISATLALTDWLVRQLFVRQCLVITVRPFNPPRDGLVRMETNKRKHTPPKLTSICVRLRSVTVLETTCPRSLIPGRRRDALPHPVPTFETARPFASIYPSTSRLNAQSVPASVLPLALKRESAARKEHEI